MALLSLLFGQYDPRDFDVRFWDGSLWASPEGRPRFTLILTHAGALRRMFANRDEGRLGECFVAGDFDIEGDLEAAFRLADHLMTRHFTWRDRLALRRLLNHLPDADRSGGATFATASLRGHTHSRARDRSAVTYHYDFSNDFFRLFLDRAMVYSCAYFASPDEDIDTAQARKLDYLCRKLRLRPGERLLDIGCGWGGLIVHAARAWGATATGITLSEAQASVAAERIREAGLESRCRVEVRDYRDLPADGRYDKIVSVGMVEHVGATRLGDFCAHAWQALRPGGVFLLHGIGTSRPDLAHRGPFAQQYVFPDSELVSIATTLAAAEAAGFEVRDVESLREHYALTLRRWQERLQARWAEASALAGEAACRVWRLFMAGAAYRFRINDYNLYQTLLAKPRHGTSGLPLTRADWYRG
ncbi:MAG: class I SAM-dependent methyltransferase [Acidobacteriota bacterium]|nr:class I SAM-dependent methyltransferase [Acidobacteriota bacterium]